MLSTLVIIGLSILLGLSIAAISLLYINQKKTVENQISEIELLTHREADGDLSSFKTVLWSQQIFIPHRASVELNVETFKSLLRYFETYPTEKNHIVISAGGWVLNDELKNLFLENVKPIIENLKKIPQVSFIGDNSIKWFDANYGYAYVTNQLVEPYMDSYSYIICNQSDISVHNLGAERFLERAITIAEELPEFGLLAFNIDFEFHQITSEWKNIVINSRKIDHIHYVDLVLEPPKDHGIAGSCTLFRTEAFKKAGGYRQTGIYMPDDAYMLKDVHGSGFRIGVLRSLFMNHGKCDAKFSDQIKNKYLHWKLTHLKESEKRAKKTRRLEQEALSELSQEVTGIFQEAFDEENK